MRFIYILEDDERVQRDLFETLRNIDPELPIRIFPTLASFHEFLKAAQADGPLALARQGFKYRDDTLEEIPPATDHELRLVIAKYEFFGKHNIGIFKRARDFFQRKKMCSPDEPTSLIFTAFDSPDFDIALAEQRIVNNVIYKPFDKLIVKLHLEYALTGHHPVTTDTVVPMQVNSTLEMLKDISLNTLSEIGFTTLNNYEISLGSFKKYYSDAFKTDEKRSAFAYCASCQEVRPQEFLCEFHFFGMDHKQVAQIRRRVLQKKDHKVKEVLHQPRQNVRILILDEDVAPSAELKTYLSERLKNAEIFVYNHMGQLMSDLADKDTANRQTLPDDFDFVFANYDLFQVDKEKRWGVFVQYFKDRLKAHGKPTDTLPDLYLMAKNKVSIDDIRDAAVWSKDIFFLPLDKSYFLRKILARNSNMANREAVNISSINDSTILKVANPAKVTKISEAGLTMKYHREISLGSFREFILWRPKELEIPEIIGTVNFTEPDKSDPSSSLIHIVFFGMKDHYLKHIRLWLLDAYIKTKDKESA